MKRRVICLLLLSTLTLASLAADIYEAECDPMQQPQSCTSGELQIKLYPPSATADLYVDGKLIASDSSEVASPVLAGEHDVEARNVVGGFGATVATTVFAGWTRHLTVDVSTPPDPLSFRNSYSWRVGVGVPNSTAEGQWVSRLGAGWWYDWRMRSNVGGVVGDYWQMIRLWNCELNPGPEVFVSEARRRPGQVWIIGNEPDAAEQDNVSAECVAELYHQAHTALKSADPTAKIAMGGVALVSPLRLQYLDTVLEAYETQTGEAMPVDIWTMHAYILNEQRGQWGAGIPTGLTEEAGLLIEVDDHDNLELFKEQVVSFRQWMAARGYLDTPLALTEYGILIPAEYGFTPERVQQYMLDTFEYLVSARDDEIGLASDGDRLIQRWAWFSMAYDVYPTSNLYDPAASTFTDLGGAFRSYLHGLE